jgi:hypothetical protein
MNIKKGYEMNKRVIISGIILIITDLVSAAEKETLDSKTTQAREAHMVGNVNCCQKGVCGYQ